jgi:hypothetical protein
VTPVTDCDEKLGGRRIGSGSREGPRHIAPLSARAKVTQPLAGGCKLRGPKAFFARRWGRFVESLVRGLTSILNPASVV